MKPGFVSKGFTAAPKAITTNPNTSITPFVSSTVTGKNSNYNSKVSSVCTNVEKQRKDLLKAHSDISYAGDCDDLEDEIKELYDSQQGFNYGSRDIALCKFIKIEDDEIVIIRDAEIFLLGCQDTFNVNIVRHILEYYNPKTCVFCNSLKKLGSRFEHTCKEGLQSYHKIWPQIYTETAGIYEFCKRVESEFCWGSHSSDVLSNIDEGYEYPCFAYTDSSIEGTYGVDWGSRPAILLIGKFLLEIPMSRRIMMQAQMRQRHAGMTSK